MGFKHLRRGRCEHLRKFCSIKVGHPSNTYSQKKLSEQSQPWLKAKPRRNLARNRRPPYVALIPTCTCIDFFLIFLYKLFFIVSFNKIKVVLNIFVQIIFIFCPI